MNGNREFGRKLAELRKACKLNQTEVAHSSSSPCAEFTECQMCTEFFAAKSAAKIRFTV